jgi:NAD(P)H-dependent FMN reductase
MIAPRPNVLCVVGTSGRRSVTHVILAEVARQLRAAGWDCDIFDPAAEPLALFNPESSHASPEFQAVKARVDRADVLVLGTPDYHGSISSTLKNFLDHFWQEFNGRLFVPIVVSHEKGLTVIDQLRTVARQCYAWTLPYGVSVSAKDEVKDGLIVSEPLQARLTMLSGDIQTYGVLLARQRQADIAGTAPGFLARLRKK